MDVGWFRMGGATARGLSNLRQNGDHEYALSSRVVKPPLDFAATGLPPSEENSEAGSRDSWASGLKASTWWRCCIEGIRGDTTCASVIGGIVGMLNPLGVIVRILFLLT